MPYRPSCTARVLVRCTSEPLRAPPLRFPAVRALVPLMLMIRPQPCCFRYGIAARAQRSAPTYFTLKSCSRSSSTIVSMGPVAVAEPPGGEPLLTRMCRPPRRSAAWATARSTCSLLVTSATSGRTRRPVLPSSSRAVASSWSFERATIATSTPSRASSRAMALPMPRLPPVTSARLPCSPKSIASPLCWLGCEHVQDRADPRGLVEAPEHPECRVHVRAEDVHREVSELRFDVGVGHRISGVALRVLRPLGEALAGVGRHVDPRRQLLRKLSR